MKRIPEEALAYGRLFDREGLPHKMKWCGYRVDKTPSDLWVYQEILADTRPDIVLEIGSGAGGSGLFLASVLDVLGAGSVVSYDPATKWARPRHPRLEFRAGDPRTDEALREELSDAVRGRGQRLMAVEDANHTFSVTSWCLDAFSPLVGRGCYYVVEDTDRHRRADCEVWLAVAEFLGRNADWESDFAREKFHHTTCHGGYLRRKGEGNDG